MKNDRTRIPVDSGYALAIGTATYCFASLEWNAAYCGDKLSQGYITTVATKTAGVIARDVVGFAATIADPATKARYQAAADEFARLVTRRNDLMHANPGTIGGDERLVRQGVPWQPDEINDLADEFAACSIELNELFQHVV